MYYLPYALGHRRLFCNTTKVNIQFCEIEVNRHSQYRCAHTFIHKNLKPNVHNFKTCLVLALHFYTSITIQNIDIVWTILTSYYKIETFTCSANIFERNYTVLNLIFFFKKLIILYQRAILIDVHKYVFCSIFAICCFSSSYITLGII